MTDAPAPVRRTQLRPAATLAHPAGRLLTLAAAGAAYVWMPDLGFRGSTLLLLSGLMLLHAVGVDGGIRALGFARPERPGRTVLTGVLLAALLLAVMKLFVAPLVDWATGQVRDLSRFDALRGNARALGELLPAIWATAAVGEEVVFRGFLMGQLLAVLGDSRTGRAVALLVSSALFGLAHVYQGPSGIVLTGLMGAVLAGVFLLERRNLWLNVVLHGTFDTLSVLLIFTSLDRTLGALWR